MAEKRRLPLIQSNAEPPSAPRPAWHWVPIGVVAIFLAWIPLLMVSLALFGRRSTAAVIAGALASVVVGCFGAGYLVGRFGERAGKREATLAGVCAAFLAWLISVLRGQLHGGVVVAVVVLAVLAPLFGAFTRVGAARGVKARKPTDG
jgi:tRNA-(ms[2]io[6]A)-hydroxylase